MTRLERDETAWQCFQYDVFAAMAHAGTSRDDVFQAHTVECVLCAEEAEELRAYVQADIAIETAHTYQGAPLHQIHIAASLLDHLFPPSRWQQFFDDLRQRWAALGRLPFAAIAWELARIEIQGALRPGQRPRYYVDQTVTLHLRIDEDCYVLLYHLDSHGRFTLLSPLPGASGFFHAGTHEFSGRVAGGHDEVQQLIALATKERLAATDGMEEVPGQAWIVALRQQVDTWPPDAWSWSEYAYRVVDPARMSLEDLEESCQPEIQDRTDREKPACGEVCRRTLDGQLAEGQRREAFALFYKITSRLVYRWIQTWFNDMLADQQGDVEEYAQEVYSRLLAANVRYQGYFPLLRYLKEIAARVVFQAYRQQKRQIVSALRTKLHGLWDRQADGAVAQTFLACLDTHGLADPLDRALLEGLLRAQRMTELIGHPVVQAALQETKTTNIEKFLYNRRDTALWHAYKSMQRIMREGSDPACLDAIAHIMT